MAVSPAWLEIDWILAAFAEDKPQAQRRYQQFVAEGQGQPSLWESLKNQIYLGSEAFVTQMQRNLAGSQRLSEIPKTQQRPNH
jgi:putative transposase